MDIIASMISANSALWQTLKNRKPIDTLQVDHMIPIRTPHADREDNKGF